MSSGMRQKVTKYPEKRYEQGICHAHILFSDISFAAHSVDCILLRNKMLSSMQAAPKMNRPL
jgi:hypothetical protein